MWSWSVVEWVWGRVLHHSWFPAALCNGVWDAIDFHGTPAERHCFGGWLQQDPGALGKSLPGLHLPCCFLWLSSSPFSQGHRTQMSLPVSPLGFPGPFSLSFPTNLRFIHLDSRLVREGPSPNHLSSKREKGRTSVNINAFLISF